MFLKILHETTLLFFSNVGFTNYKLFRQMFFEHFEATPTEVRKMHDTKKKS